MLSLLFDKYLLLALSYGIVCITTCVYYLRELLELLGCTESKPRNHSSLYFDCSYESISELTFTL